MHEQINLFGEEIQVATKAKKFEDILIELQETIQDKNKNIAHLENIIRQLSEENEKLKVQITKPKLVEVGAFEKSKVNYRPLIHVFVDWIGYEMFIKGGAFERLPQEEQKIYSRVWDKCIRPTYKEFCKQNGGL